MTPTQERKGFTSNHTSNLRKKKTVNLSQILFMQIVQMYTVFPIHLLLLELVVWCLALICFV